MCECSFRIIINGVERVHLPIKCDRSSGKLKHKHCKETKLYDVQVDNVLDIAVQGDPWVR